MSRLYWYGYGALALTFSLLLAWFVWSGLSAYKTEHAYQRVEASKYEYERSKHYVRDCVTDIPSIAEGLACLAESMESANEAQRAKYDLQAQQEMVEWAYALFWISAGGLGVTIVGLFLVVGTLSAAVRGNDLTRENLIADQRAWLTVKLTIESDLNFAVGGGFSVSTALQVENIGRTPALDAHTLMDITVDGMSVSQRLQELSEQGIEETANAPSRMVLPNESYRREWAPSVGAHEITQFTVNGTISPTIFGVLTYRILPDRSLHQTAFIYDLWEKDQHGNFADLLRPGVSRRKDSVACEVGTGGWAS